MTWRVETGDCVELMAAMPPCSVDAVVCDPPYGLEFMGKEWDRLGGARIRQPSDRDGQPGAAHNASTSLVTRNQPDAYVAGPRMQAWHKTWAVEALRVLKPGGHLLAFGGTRTSHRLACAIEDAGFEIRDTIAYMYGSGFPKSLDVSKAIDKAAGNHPGNSRAAQLGHFIRQHREAAGLSRSQASELLFGSRTGAFWNWEEGLPQGKHPGPDPASWPRIKEVIRAPDSEWDDLLGQDKDQRPIIGRGHAGLTAGNIANFRGESEFDLTTPATPDAERWNGWGTALKPAHEPIVVARKPLAGTVAANVLEHGTGALNVDGCRVRWDSHELAAKEVWHERYGGKDYGSGLYEGGIGANGSQQAAPNTAGRWPANAVFDEEAAAMLDAQSGNLATVAGGASRFFYTAKASRAERNAGLDGFEERDEFRTQGAGRSPVLRCPVHKASIPSGGTTYSCGCAKVWDGREGRPHPVRNVHPTVKPVSLMRWLTRLVTPPGGVVLDPFCGSGTEGIAAVLEGFHYIGHERDPDYVAIARARIAWWAEHGEDALRIVAEQERAEAEREKAAAAGQLDIFGVDA